MGDKAAIQRVMQAAAAGELSAVKVARTVGGVAFRRSDVMRYFGTPLLEAGMSIQQLSKASGWKWESIAHWIDEGLLESHEIVLRGHLLKQFRSDLTSHDYTWFDITESRHAQRPNHNSPD